MRLRIPPLPFQLIGVILFVVLFGRSLPLYGAELCYTFSILFKELLSLILPFMVFFFVLDGILSFKKNAPVVLSVMLGTIFVSNALVALFSYGIMNFVYPVVSCEKEGLVGLRPLEEVHSLITVTTPFSINAVHALMAAIAIGLIGSFYPLGIDAAIARGRDWVEDILQRVIIPFLPLYVLGFVLKIRYEGMLTCLIQQYGSALLLVVTMQTVYLLCLYLVALGFDVKKVLRAISNALPSYLTAFSTMSSAVAIPDSIKGARQNTGNRGLANVAMPIMANVHLLGDSIGISVIAMVTMLIFQGALPAFSHYMLFVMYFCLSMFAASGIPGGAILVIIPILKSQLGFDAEMVSVVLTICLLMDSFGTAANVMGDGALVIIVNRLLKRLRIA